MIIRLSHSFFCPKTKLFWFNASNSLYIQFTCVSHEKKAKALFFLSTTTIVKLRRKRTRVVTRHDCSLA